MSTTTPTQTLLMFSTPTFKPTAILRLLRTPTLRSSSTALAVVATPIAVSVDPPTCDEMPVGSVWCFGLVRNLASVAVEQITIQVYLVTMNGDVLVEKSATPANSVLMPNQTSPYGVLFDSMPEKAVGAISVVTNVIRLSLEEKNSIANITVSNVKYESYEGFFHISATLTNRDKQPAHDISIIVTLLNEDQQVTGYRKQKLSQSLMAGQSMSFQLEVISQGRSTKRIELSAEAWH